MTIKTFTLACVAFCIAACGKSPGSATGTTTGAETGDHQTQAQAHDQAGTPGSADHAHGEHKAGEHEAGEHEAGNHNHDGPLGHRFERAEDWVKRFDDPERTKWQKPEDVIALMNIEPGMAVADIGAGTGYFLPYLSAAVGASGTVVGLDVEADMVRHIKERAAREKLANVSARVVPFDDPGLGEAAVDRVLIVNTWHHIPDREAYAAKLARGLKPGGAVYLVDYTMESDRGPPKSHRIEPEVAARELAAGGLETEIRTDVLPKQYIVIARRR